MEVKLVSVTQPVDRLVAEGIKTAEDLIVYTARVSSPTNQTNMETGPKLLQYLITNRHWSPFELATLAVEITTSRAIAAQILRHRSFSFQEFCVSGDTQVSCIAACGAIRRRTIKELFTLQYDTRWGRLIRVYDDTTKTLVPSKVKEVFSTGVKKVWLLTLESGRTVKSTLEHKFLTREGFVPLENIQVGAFVGTNGEPCYQSESWLAEQRAQVPTRSLSQIATNAGCSTMTIRKWLRRYRLQYTRHEVASYTPIWNKGLPPTEQPMFGKGHTSATREKQAESARKGAASPLYVNGNSQLTSFRQRVWQWQAKHKNALLRRTPTCTACGAEEHLQLDHKVPVSADPSLAFDINNLQVLCFTCHKMKDRGALQTIKWSPVKSIVLVGEEDTYDLEVEHPSHNYVANGIITHNSLRYAASPCEFEPQEARVKGDTNRQGSLPASTTVERLWQAQLKEVQEQAVMMYQAALRDNIAPEVARMMLPLGVQTRLYMTGTVRSWIHYLEARIDSHAQKEHRDIALEIQKIFAEQFPITHAAVFEKEA